LLDGELRLGLGEDIQHLSEGRQLSAGRRTA
jgi:hypothetical protein